MPRSSSRAWATRRQRWWVSGARVGYRLIVKRGSPSKFHDDPDILNPAQSFRTREPLRVVGELVDWVGHSPEQLEAVRAALDELQRNGTAQIED